MLSLLRGISARLLAIGLVVVGAGVGILLIVLWQLGLFDSAPPPASLESAVESIRQQQTQAQSQPAEQSQTAEGAQPVEQVQPEQRAESQPQAEQQAGPQAEQEAESTQSSPAAPPQSGQQSDQQSAQQSGSSAETTQQAQSPSQATQSAPLSLADLAGTWALSEAGDSFVGYRIGEELANIGTTEAVGRTGEIEAALEFDGAAITAVTIVADLRTLRSDQAFRDGALSTRGIETDIYPFATFVLTEPIVIEALPSGAEPLAATVAGTLELHGVTNPVSIALEGQYVDGLVVVVGSTEIALADYEIEKPTGFRVLSIEDIGIMEFQLVLERSQ